MTSLKDAKKWLRAYFTSQRKDLSKKTRTVCSQRAVSHFLNSSAYKRSKIIGVYLSFGSEIETSGLIERAWRDKKVVGLPITKNGLTRPYFGEYKKDSRLVKSGYGPMELSGFAKKIPFDRFQLIVIPGIAFDQDGFRLGFGGGTYDRIMKKTRRAFHMGLGFDIQRGVRLPRGEHDQKLDGLTTEKGVRTFAKPGD